MNDDCTAFQTGRVSEFPVKTKKVKVSDLSLKYFFVKHKDHFLIKQRGNDFIWKKLYEFPISIPENWTNYIVNSKIISHKLTHKNMTIEINTVEVESKSEFETFALKNDYIIVEESQAEEKSFPKPLENFYKKRNISETGKLAF